MANKTIFSSSAVVLNWNTVSGANKYTLQVSDKPDFSGTLIVNDATLTTGTKSFTDTGAEDSKRWWRWRYSTDGGTTWSTWRVVGMYWVRTGATAFQSSTDGWWMIADASTADVSAITPFPIWKITSEKMFRSKTRNRAGDLLSEYLTIKDTIDVNFPEATYADESMVAEIQRFDKVVKTFFLVCFRKTGQGDGKADIVPQIWRGQLVSAPAFDLHSPGEYLMVGGMSFEEA